MAEIPEEKIEAVRKAITELRAAMPQRARVAPAPGEELICVFWC